MIESKMAQKNPLFLLNYLLQVSPGYSQSAVKEKDPEENSQGNRLAVFNIIVGVFLIGVQFFFSKSFIGTGYNKFYFDIIFFCFLFLIVISCIHTNFFKIGLILGTSIYISAFILNHMNIFEKVAMMIPMFGSKELSIVVYYISIIGFSALFAKGILQDNVKEVSDSAILAILSILIPFFLIKLNPYSSYLISNEIGGTLIKLFFSIPLLWQPFWIAGVYKRMNEGSKTAKIFLTFWMILILGIFMLISYFSVPITARQSIQTSGSNFLTGSFDDLQKAVNDTKSYYERNILGINEPTPIETQVDDEQKFPNKGFTISTIKLSEGDYVQYGENTIDRLDAWATLEAKGLENDNHDILTKCELKISGYENLFIDPKKDVIFEGKLNNQEGIMSAKLKDFSVGRTVTCSFDKEKIEKIFVGETSDDRVKKIKQTTQTLTYYSNYSFKTGAYLTRYFMNENLFLESKKESYDDYDLLSKQGVLNSQKYLRSRYTSGPLSVAISISDSGIVIPFKKDNPMNLLLTVEFSFVESDSNKEIIGLNNLSMSIPDVFEIDVEKCSPVKFEKIEIRDENEMPFYKISDLGEADKFFRLNYMDTKKRFMCPMTVKTDVVTTNLFKGSFEIIADYKVTQKKTLSISVK